MKPARTFILLIAVAFGAPALAQDALVGQEKFTALYIEAMRTHAPELEAEQAGPMELSITTENGPFTAYLDNAYARYRGDPGQLFAIIDEYVAATVETALREDQPVDVTRIVPVVKGVDYLEALRQGVGGDANETEALDLASDPYNDHLVVLYAEDTPRNIRYLSETDLEVLGVDRAGLREMAVENLRGLLPPMEARGSDGTYMLIADGNYEASLLLFDDIWTGGSLPVAGELVVAVPSRDILLVTGSQDAEGLGTVREIAGEVVVSDPYFLTNQLFVYRDGRFQLFDG